MNRMADKLIILYIAIILFSSCGIGIIGGKRLSCKDSEVVLGSDVDEAITISVNRILEQPRHILSEVPYESFEDFIYDLDKDTLIPVKTVIRCYHPMCGRANVNHRSLLMAGYHFLYNGKRYRVVCGNITRPKYIMNGRLFFPVESLSSFWRIGYQNVKFASMYL